ncbi:MAG: hypothetical protein HFJ02_04060, partial [Bacilli bacterium]|nr:hypothetical protein [Bacilli bacterium]
NIEFTKNLSTEEYNKYLEAGISLRRNTYRGKDITEYYSDGSLYEMISSGTFDDIYVGDYIVANNVTWLIADIDNYLNTGNGENRLRSHHVTMIPRYGLINAVMNETETTEGGYYNSKMVQETLPIVFNEYIEPVFQNHVLTYFNFLTDEMREDFNSYNAINFPDPSGASSKASWYTRKIDLMSEVNVFGFNTNSSNLYDTGIDSQQYAIFKLQPGFIGLNSSEIYWLKNVANKQSFSANFEGSPSYYAANATWLKVRPRFLIG